MSDQHINRYTKDYLYGRGVPVWVTVTFQGEKDLEDAKENLIRFHRDIDRQLIGKNFNRVSTDIRTYMYAIPEQIGSKNLHFHILFIPANNQIDKFIQIAEDLWRKIDWWEPYPKKNPEEGFHSPNRHLKYCTEDDARPFDLVRIDDSSDRRKIIDYSFKDDWMNLNNKHHVVTNPEFYGEVTNNRGREMLNERKQVALSNGCGLEEFMY
jgi:hypothetical protein